MFGEYSIGDLGAIFAMQGFAGLILFSVYVLMALGLAASGFAMGFLAGLFGIGGGAILVPVLYEAFRIAGVDQSIKAWPG